MRAVLCLCVLLVSGSVFADPTPKPDVELEQRFRAELEKVSADAAAAWDQGNAARETRFADAETAYRKAIALAPNVDHPHRRLCGVYEQMGRLDDAVRECEQALALAPTSAYDEGAIAAALLRRGHEEDHARARSHTRPRRRSPTTSRPRGSTASCGRSIAISMTPRRAWITC